MDLSKVRALQDGLHSMLTWFLSPKSKGLELVDGFHCTRMIAQNISLGYQNLPKTTSRRIVTELFVPELDTEEYLSKDAVYLRPIIELKQYASERLRDHLDALLVIGSMATLDYSRGWSDLDTYLIVKNETIFEPNSLLKLRELLLSAYSYLLRIDPLQHHGFLCCTAADLIQYPSYYMPVNVLKYSKSILGEYRVAFHVLPGSIGVKERFQKHVGFFKKTYESGILKHHAYNGEYLLDNFHNADNAMYQMKNFLEFVTLLPAYFLEAKGTPCYKRDSFDLVRPYVPDENWELTEIAGLIRKEWENKEVHPYTGNRVPDWLIDMLGANYFKRMYELVKVLWKHLANE